MNMRFKKGAAHFEMIMAFLFFTAFIFFLFVNLRPYDNSTLPIAVLDGFYDSFEEEVYTNLTSVFLRVDGGCFNEKLPVGLMKFEPTKSLVKKAGGDVVDSTISGDNLVLGSAGSYEVLISPVFEDEVVSCGSSSVVSQFGSVLERRVLFYGYMGEMVEDYGADYSGLRERLGIPEIFDFEISSSDLPSIKMSRNAPDSAEIFAREYISEVLYSDGTIVNARVVFRIW